MQQIPLIFDHSMDRHGIYNQSALDLLSPELLARCRVQQYKEGEIISLAGDKLTEVGFFASGHAIGSDYDEHGNQVDSFLLDTAIGSIGMMEVWALQPFICSTIVAACPTTIYWLPLDLVYSHFMTDIDCVRHYAFHLAIALTRNTVRERYLHSNGRGKLAFFLVTYCNNHAIEPGDTLVVQESFADIARQVEASEKTVQRAARELEQDGLIGRQGRKITVHYDQFKRLMLV